MALFHAILLSYNDKGPADVVTTGAGQMLRVKFSVSIPQTGSSVS